MSISRKKLAQGNLVQSSASQTSVFNPNTKADSFPSDDCSFPRNEVLSLSLYGFSPKKPDSPEKQEPITVLDLSEPENDQNSKTEVESREKTNHNNVIVVDALSQTIAPDMAEVDVKETVSKSPYKVICHSPRAAKQSLLQRVDDSTTLVDISKPKSLPISHLARGNIVSYAVKETVTREDIEDHVSDNSQDESEPQKRLLDERYDDVLKLDEKESVVHTADHTVKDIENVEPKVTKKKKGKVVASRFLETTAAHRAKAVGQSQQSSYRSMLEKSRRNKPKYLNDCTMPTNNTKLGIPSPVRKRNVPRQASTPENTSLPPNESFDVSALTSNKTIHRTLNESESFCAVDQFKVAQNKGKATSSKTRMKKKDKMPGYTTTENVTQDTIDVVYSRYLQWLFLSSKVHKSIEQEEKDVMSQLQPLWLENRRMKQKLSSLTEEHDRLQHVTELGKMLDVQKKSLGPIINELPTLSQNYKSMSEAVASTQHELKTKGIHIPPTQPERLEFEEKLLSVLEESEDLLGRITACTRHQVPKTAQYAQAVDNLASTMADEERNLLKCQELIKAAQTLSNQENSMKIQDIEFSTL